MKIFSKIVLVVCVILVASNYTNAQVYVGGLQEYIDYSNINNVRDRINNPYSNFSGSPFLNKDFKKGQIKLNNGKIYEGRLRYDVYADQIEFEMSDGNIYAVKNPETIKEVTIGKQNFISLNKEAGNSLDGIYEIVAKGEFMLLEKHEVEL